MRAIILVLALGCVSCAAPTRYKTQAGPSPLECALDFGINNGYTPAAGGTNAGFIRLERHTGAFAATRREVDVVTVTVLQRELHVTADGFGPKGEELGASARVKREASEIVRRCGAADSTSRRGAA